MSYKTEQTWFYYLNGRILQLYQRSDYGRTDTLGSYKIRLPDDSSGTYFIYPDEDITDGLRMEYTSLATPFIAEGLEDMQVFADGTGISFDPGPAATISDTNDGFGDFAQGDKIRVIGSTSNDGDYTLSSSGTVDEDTLTITGTFTTETAGQSITIYQIPKAVTTSSADESSHMNLNRMLSLACLDYLKAMLSDREGDIERKEYYMKEFWGKVGDNESNKRKISMSFPSSPYALK